MRRSPRTVWHRLPDGLKQQIIEEFTDIFKEVLHEHIRDHSAQTTSVASPSSTSASRARTRPWPIKRVSNSNMTSSTAPAPPAGTPATSG